TLLLNTSYSGDGLFKKINNVVLICRASQYARDKRSETSRPSLKTRGKMERAAVSQQRSCHGDSQRIDIVWFITDAIRNDYGPIPSRGRIDFPNHVVPCVSRSSGFGETNKFQSSRRGELVRKARGEPLRYA